MAGGIGSSVERKRPRPRARDGPSANQLVPWTTSRVHSTPSRPGARPPGRCPRIRRWRPTRSASRRRWPSSASGWRRSYPFHHPRYAGQMLKPPHPVAIAAYTAAMHVNANNHALDGGPATSALEVEVVRDLARDVRLPGRRARPPHLLGHDREPRGAVGGARAAPGQGDRATAPTRTTRTRACAPCSGRGSRRRDSPAGSTSTPSRRCAERRRRHGRRHRGHDRHGHRRRRRAGGRAARALRRPRPRRRRLRRLLHAARRARPGRAPFRAIADADSVVVDPHKHGLQPYGCGAVLFRDPGVGRLYKHDSPYTYFTSGDLHLGEISLECSRAGRRRGGAVADAALARPRADPGRRRARRARLGGADRATPTCCACTASRELDIVTYFPTRAARVGDRRRQRARARRRDDRPTTRSSCSTLRIDGARLRRRAPGRRDGRRRRARPAQSC